MGIVEFDIDRWCREHWEQGFAEGFAEGYAKGYLEEYEKAFGKVCDRSYDELYAKGYKAGQALARRKSVEKLIRENMPGRSLEDICTALDFPLEEGEKIAESVYEESRALWDEERKKDVAKVIRAFLREGRPWEDACVLLEFPLEEGQKIVDELTEMADTASSSGDGAR